MERLLMTLAMLVSALFGSIVFTSTSFSQPIFLSLQQFASEYNKNRVSTEQYLVWIAQFESVENVSYLRNAFEKNPNIELREIDIISSTEIAYRGKKSYIRVNISKLDQRKLIFYNNEVDFPIYSPLRSILLFSKTKSLFDLVLPKAHANQIQWNDNLDVLTSLRLWASTTFSSNLLNSGKYTTYCGRGEKPKYDAVSNWFKEVDSKSNHNEKDACYELMLQMGRVVTHYNQVMAEYSGYLNTIKANDEATDKGRGRAGMTSSTALASNNADIPNCIVQNVIVWKRNHCKTIRTQKYKNCKITSTPPSLFNCSQTYQSTGLPQEINLNVKYTEPRADSPRRSSEPRGSR